MLQDIGDGKIFIDTIEKAKKIIVYIYRYGVFLSMFRGFTGDQELTRSVVTKFATLFFTLKKFHELKTPIQELFASKSGPNVTLLLQITRSWLKILFFERQ